MSINIKHLAICPCGMQVITGNAHLTFDIVMRVSSFINSCDFFFSPRGLLSLLIYCKCEYSCVVFCF